MIQVIVESADGGMVDIPIEFMEVKDSLFVPTLQPRETKNILRMVARTLEITIECKTGVIDGYYGVLIWRSM